MKNTGTLYPIYGRQGTSWLYPRVSLVDMYGSMKPGDGRKMYGYRSYYVQRTRVSQALTMQVVTVRFILPTSSFICARFWRQIPRKCIADLWASVTNKLRFLGAWCMLSVSLVAFDKARNLRNICAAYFGYRYLEHALLSVWLLLFARKDALATFLWHVW